MYTYIHSCIHFFFKGVHLGIAKTAGRAGTNNRVRNECKAPSTSTCMKISKVPSQVLLESPYSLPSFVEIISVLDGVEHIRYESIVCLLPVSNEYLP